MGLRAVRKVASGNSQVSEGQEEKVSGRPMTKRVFPEMRTPGGMEEKCGREDSSQRCWGWTEDA